MVINKQRLFDLLEIHYKRPTGQLLSEIRHRLRSLGKIAPVELGDGGKKPEGIWEWLLSKDGVLMEEGQGLTVGDVIKAFRTSGICKNYRFREGRCAALSP